MSYPGTPSDNPYPPPYPVSDPGFAGLTPTSASPTAPVTAGYPTPFPPPVTAPIAPAPKRNGATLLLAVLAVVLFLSTVVFLALYVTKSTSDNHRIANRDKTISTDRSQIDDLRKQLQTTKDQLTDLQQKQTGTQNQLDEITKEKQVISNCLTLLAEAGQAAQAGDKATYNQKSAEADTVCSEAQKYLD